MLQTKGIERETWPVMDARGVGLTDIVQIFPEQVDQE